MAASAGKDFLPRVAVALNAGMVSDIVKFNADAFTFERPIFAGNLTQIVKIETEKKK